MLKEFLKPVPYDKGSGAGVTADAGRNKIEYGSERGVGFGYGDGNGAGFASGAGSCHTYNTQETNYG